MADLTNTTHNELAPGFELHREGICNQRQPLLGAALVMVLAIVVVFVTAWMEWHGFSFVLNQFFEASSDDGSAVDTSTMAWMSLFGIFLTEIFLLKQGEPMSDRFRARLMHFGFLGAFLLIAGLMMFISAGIWYANTPVDGDGVGMVSLLGYFSNGLMLAGLVPLSICSNFFTIGWAKDAFRTIERVRDIERQIAKLDAFWAECEATATEAATVGRAMSELPDDNAVADYCAAELAAEIGEVAGAVRGLIAAREAALHATADKPLKASPDDLWNHRPIERMHEHFDYLSTFTHAAIRERIAPKEVRS